MIEKDKEMVAQEEETDEQATARLIQAVTQYRKDLKNLSKNDLVRMIIGLTAELQRYQLIVDKMNEMASNAQSKTQEGESNAKVSS